MSTLQEVIDRLDEKHQEAMKASENFDDTDALYHEGRADAYGVALAMVKAIATKAELIEIDMNESDVSNYGRG